MLRDDNDSKEKILHTYNCQCEIILDVEAALSLTVAISNGRV